MTAAGAIWNDRESQMPGATDNPSNYRPIAVVSVVANILEKIVAAQLSNHIVSNNL